MQDGTKFLQDAWCDSCFLLQQKHEKETKKQVKVKYQNDELRKFDSVTNDLR